MFRKKMNNALASKAAAIRVVYGKEINLRLPRGVLLVLDVNVFNLPSPCDHWLQASGERLLCGLSRVRVSTRCLSSNVLMTFNMSLAVEVNEDIFMEMYLLNLFRHRMCLFIGLIYLLIVFCHSERGVCWVNVRHGFI